MRRVCQGAAAARPAGCASWADGGWRPVSCPASGIGSSGSVPVWPAVDTPPLPFAAKPGGSACCIAGWSPPPLGCPAGGGVSVRCGGPPISSVASTVGSSRSGCAGGAGGVAASPVSRAASRAWPSDTGGGPGPLPGPADRGASAGTVACAGSGLRSGLQASRPGADRSVGCTGLYRAVPGWWGVVPVGRRFGLCRGLQVVSRGRCAGRRRSLGIGALGGVVGVGVHGAGGPGAGGVGRCSGTCLRWGAFGWRVC